MKTNRLVLSVALATFGLAGCATPFQAPSDVAHIKLSRGDSPIVRVEKIWLERKGGPLVIRGYVLKRLESEDTTRTHLDVTLFDAAGNGLRSTVEYFEPRKIPLYSLRENDASYSVVVDPLPVGTVRIEVRAHEGEHPARS